MLRKREDEKAVQVHAFLESMHRIHSDDSMCGEIVGRLKQSARSLMGLGCCKAFCKKYDAKYKTQQDDRRSVPVDIASVHGDLKILDV